MKSSEPVRAIAFHLPQYHPIPENDAWWGKGFTEWTNVAKARPLFRGHEQPLLPADLGFYDLRLPEARAAQAELAREYGIHGFCYYHYWFGGRRLLERPVNEILSSGEPDFPFCLCWANENWTRVWDGGNKEILCPQAYSAEDDRNHIRWLLGAFADRRYIRVAGKPLFLVYRVSDLPEPQRTTDIWREEAERAGLGELYLCSVESSRTERDDPLSVGFDAAVEFQPDWRNFGARADEPGLWTKRMMRMGQRLGVYHGDWKQNRSPVFEYGQLVENMLRKPRAEYVRIPCVMPCWDNSPRRGVRGQVVVGACPELYEKWLRGVIETKLAPPPVGDLVFIDAWNEWAEGNILEPSQRWGRGFLEATRRALTGATTSSSGQRVNGAGVAAPRARVSAEESAGR